MKWLLLSSPLLLPIAAFVAVRVGTGAGVRWQVLAAGAAGAVGGAFLGSAVAALASAVSPGEAALRGGLAGFAAGLAVGALAAGALALAGRVSHRRPLK